MDELIKALKRIKDVCSTHECIFCPMGTDSGHCLIMVKSANEWEITEPIGIIRVMK